MDSDLADGADSVQIEGNPVATVSSKIAISSGNEPGTIGGIISNKIKGTATWKIGSLDIKTEGKSVVRFLDSTFYNGNGFNSSLIAPGVSGYSYGDDYPNNPCTICGKASQEHAIYDKLQSNSKCRDFVKSIKQSLTSISEDGLKLYENQNEKTQEEASEINKSLNKICSNKQGYMIGVMACKCVPPKFFGAVSLNQTISDNLRKIANTLSIELINNKPAATEAEVINSNTSEDANRKKLEERIKATYTYTKMKSASNKSDSTIKNNGFTQPGNCAGTQLVAKSGHAPAEMTEMYMFPPEKYMNFKMKYNEKINDKAPFNKRTSKELGGYKIIDRSDPNPTNHKAIIKNYEITGDDKFETIVSCNTCRLIIPLMMCPERKCL
jgi:hypothetical protein